MAFPSRPSSAPAPAVTRPGVGKRVALFATCINDTLYPQTCRAATTVLERLGCTLVFPMGQTCCGQMMTNTGYFNQAIPVVRNYVRTFGCFDYIVAPSGSCVGSVREQHAMLARHAGDVGLERQAAEIARRTYDLSEFLVDVLEVVDVGAYFPHRVTYHPTCHSVRVTKVGDRPHRLLSAVRGIELVPLPLAEQCCGFGGTFSLKNPDISAAMVADKAQHVRETGSEYLVAGDNSCLMNIGGALQRQRSGIRTIHLAEILACTEEDS